MAISTIGAKLKYDASGTFTEITGVISIPSLGGKKDKIDVTTLGDSVKKTIFGIRDLGDLQFKFIYDNSSATANYRVLTGFETAGTAKTFNVELTDGTKLAFSAYVSVELGEMSVNKAQEFTCTMALNSAITITNPV